MTTQQFTSAPVGNIVPSPYQQRTVFGGKQDDELTESVRLHGVLQPLRVRKNGTPTTFELVFGERRWRAAQAAGLEEVPVIVVELSDDQVIEQILIENMQRRDLGALEEADGFQQLIDKCGYTVDDIAAKTGKSKAFVYGRLKLCSLIAEGRKALTEGKLPAACAELIARQDKKLQPEILSFALGHEDFADYDTLNIAPEGIGEEGKRVIDGDDTQPLSFRALQALIHRKYTLRLVDAPFPTYDETLVAEAGACSACPHRSSVQPELFPDLKKPADSCTKPSCFEMKVKANWERSQETAKNTNTKVLPAKEAKEIFGHGGAVAHHADYVDPNAELPHEIAKPGSKQTWGKLLGKAAGQVPKVLVQDERGAPRELLDKKAAVKLLREAGKLDEGAKRDSGNKEAKEERAKAKAKREIRAEAFKRILVSVGQGAAEFDLAGPKKLPLLRWLAQGILDNCKYGSEEAVAALVPDGKVASDSASDKIAAAIQKAGSPGQVLGIAAALLIAGCQDAIVGEWQNQPEATDCFLDGVKLFGADWNKALSLAKDAAKAEAKVEAAKTVKKHGACGAAAEHGKCVLPKGHTGDHSAPAPKAKKGGAK